MSIYNNTSSIKNLYAGTSQVKRVYKGGLSSDSGGPMERKVWEQAPTFWTFGGLNIAHAPLRHNGSSFYMKDLDDWMTRYYSVEGTVNQSTHFSFLQLGRAFSSQGSSFSTSSGDITNTYKTTYAGYSDWRIPTKTDWEGIIGSARQGSTINGVPGCRYSIVIVDDYGAASSPTYCYGLLLFPDGVTKTGMSRTFTWNSYTSTHTSIAEIYEYTDWGCVFLPALGYYSSSWNNRGYQGWYQCATSYDSTYNYILFFNGSSVYMNNGSNKNTTYSQVRLVRGAPSINVKIVVHGNTGGGSTNVSIVLKDPTDLSHMQTFYVPVSSSSVTQTGVLQLNGGTFTISSSTIYGTYPSSIRITSYNGGYAKTGYYSSGTWSGTTLTKSNYIYPSDGTLWLDITVS